MRERLLWRQALGEAGQQMQQQQQQTSTSYEMNAQQQYHRPPCPNRAPQTLQTNLRDRYADHNGVLGEGGTLRPHTSHCGALA